MATGSNCVITNGLQLSSCVNNVPGVESIWVLTSTGSTADFESITYNVDGTIASVSGATGLDLMFKKIDVVRNSSAALNEEVSVNLESLGFTFNTSLIFTIPGLNQDATNLYQEIVKNVASYFIVKLKTGKWFLAGADGGCFISSATIASGSLPGDSQLYTLTLTSNGSISVPELDIATTLSAFLAGSNISVDRE
jgi:hypothetical protein